MDINMNTQEDAFPKDAFKVRLLLAELDKFAEQGQLRRIGAAFARFMASLGMSEPAHLVSCAGLSELEGRGHSCLLLTDLADDPAALLGLAAEPWQRLSEVAGVMPKDVAGWRACLQQCAQIWHVGNEDRQQPLVLADDKLYLRRYWKDETRVAQVVTQLAQTSRAVDETRIKQWLDKLFDQHNGPSSAQAEPNWQKIACAIAVRSHLSIITGGPGTGKTYTVARLLALLFALSAAPDRLRIALAAPTGKAAARLKQSIDNALIELSEKISGELPLAELTARMGAARTLHSLLGTRPNTRAFKYHAGNPLELDVLIVDEASMVHLEMMACLLDALPANAIIVLLGDKDQLASVEAGAVLGDMCLHAEQGGYSAATVAYVANTTAQTLPAKFLGASSALAQQTVMLRYSHRFTGPISDLAIAVNAGVVADAMRCLRAQSGQILSWQEHAHTEHVLQLALYGRDGCAGGYGNYLTMLDACPDSSDASAYALWVSAVLQAFESFRILCAVREGDWGVAGLNKAIEKRLEEEGRIKRSGEWYVGRPVMVTRNDYGLGVFNGDIGITLADSFQGKSLRVYFLAGQTLRSVLATRLPSVETAYAMTVHKSQGSEFHHTVVVLPRESSPVITRELIYTGITRSQKFFTLVTSVATVFEDAIKTKLHRGSGLGALLHGNPPPTV
jgi:exodeoxyribonuclease V alpha subunit